MEKNYGWRWSRFCEPTVLTDYSNALSFRKMAFWLVVIGSIVLVWSTQIGLLWALILLGILGFVLLAPLCAPTDVVRLYKGKIYVFYKQVKSQISYELVDTLNRKIYVATDYETFTRTLGKDIGFLIFKDKYTKNWYYLCAEDKSPVELGKRLGKILFIDEENADQKQLSILADGTIKHLTVQSFFYNNFGTTTPLSGKSAPDELLLVKADGVYKLYGLYTKEDETLRYRELNYYDVGDMGIYFHQNNALVWLKCTKDGIFEKSSSKVC